MYQVLRLRIYRKHNAKLTKLASAVNYVWNYVNDLCLQMWRRKRVFPSAYDVAEYTKGGGKNWAYIHKLSSSSVRNTTKHANSIKKSNWLGELTAKMQNVKH